ncbi:SGNH/GDSL hydrolase family protein [Cohnella soli]|uniref:SGNH/GDSL hydrolase family protein n=1 Tax=Cohnella soli TaxID=425005 RepID=A0ABW0HZ30_9BACL
MSAEKECNVVFFGGSITVGSSSSQHENSWAYRVSQYLKRRLKGFRVQIYNAGLSGTGTGVGVFRLQTEVLTYRPDLVWIEFAVNDYWDAAADEQKVLSSLEYIVNTLIRQNPLTKIILVYSAMKGWKACSDVHEKVAQHYRISSIDVQEHIRSLVENGVYEWEHLFADDVHPNDKGHEIYASYISEKLQQHWTSYMIPGRVPESCLGERRYAFPRIVGLEEVSRYGDWKRVTSEEESLTFLNDTVREALCSRTPGSELEFTFYGKCIGIYHYISRDSGICSVQIDDQAETTLDWYYPSPGEFLSFYVRSDLDEREHVLKLKIHNDKNAESNGTLIAISGFMID